jgi:hypothetical protein
MQFDTPDAALPAQSPPPPPAAPPYLAAVSPAAPMLAPSLHQPASTTTHEGAVSGFFE